METTNNSQSELIQSLQIRNDNLREQLEERNQRFEQARNEQQERHDQAQKRLADQLRLRDTQRQIEQSNRNAITNAFQRLQGNDPDIDQATATDAYYLSAMETAFTVARLLGYTSETEHVAQELDLAEIWDKVYEATKEHADKNEVERFLVIRESVWRFFDMGIGQHRHPAERQYRDLWKRAVMVAKNAGYCDEFERVAEFVGIPTDFEFTYSGTMRVYVEGWFDVEIEGETTSDVYDVLSGIDISDHYDELEITAEWQEMTLDED
jgi:hypothetical protein